MVYSSFEIDAFSSSQNLNSIPSLFVLLASLFLYSPYPNNMQGPTILLDQKDQTLMTDKTKADGDTGHTVASDPDGTMGESIDISSQKHFSFWSTMGINFGAFLPPLAIGSYLALSIGAGGSAGYIYGFLCAFIFQLFVCASAAEMSAVFPHTGGT